MFENNIIQPRVSRSFAGSKQRSVPFAQRDNVRFRIQEVDKFAVTPNTALVNRRVAHPPFAPDFLKLLGGKVQLRLRSFQ